MLYLKTILSETNTGLRLLEATGDITVYDATTAFPDNIALPFRKGMEFTGQKGKELEQFVLRGYAMPYELEDMFQTLETAFNAGKLDNKTITILSSATNAAATTKLPDVEGSYWEQYHVDYSYGGKDANGKYAKPVTNTTLKKTRAEVIEKIIYMRLGSADKLTAKGIKIVKKYGSGSKSVKISVPIQTMSVTSGKKEFKSDRGTESFNLNPDSYYTVPDVKTAEITKCNINVPIDKAGKAGDPIAYRTKLDTKTGKINVNFFPAFVPDRLVIYRGTEVLKDTGYISNNPTEAQILFGKILADLNKKKKNGYNGTIKSSSEGNFTLDLGKQDTGDVICDIYGPLGETAWGLFIRCKVDRKQIIKIQPHITPRGSVKIEIGKVYSISGNLHTDGYGYIVSPRSEQEAKIIQDFVDAQYVILQPNTSKYGGTPVEIKGSDTFHKYNLPDWKFDKSIADNNSAIQAAKTFLTKIHEFKWWLGEYRPSPISGTYLTKSTVKKGVTFAVKMPPPEDVPELIKAKIYKQNTKPPGTAGSIVVRITFDSGSPTVSIFKDRGFVQYAKGTDLFGTSSGGRFSV